MKKIIPLIIVLGIFLIFLPQALADLDDGLEAYYPFNGNADDESGNGYDGIIHGDTSLCEDRFGSSDSAYYFDGDGDYIDLGTELNISGWENYAVNVWFLNDGGGDWSSGYGQMVINKTDWYKDFWLSVDDDDGRLFFCQGSNFENCIVDVSKDYRDNQWHHVVINNRHGDIELWIDGELFEITYNVPFVYNDKPLLIGYSLSGDWYQRKYWSGKIDYIRIYRRALSEDEILALYSGWYGDELAIDFGALGLWNFDTAGTWRPISGGNVETMAGWANGLAMDFVGTDGVWNVDGTAWSQISGSDVETMVGWADGLALDFGTSGVWNVDTAGIWTPISGDAETMAAWANGLALDFGAAGVWNVDTAGTWTPISGDAEIMVGWAKGLAMDFGALGLWNVDTAGTWTMISKGDVTNIAAWAKGLAMGLGSFGLFNVDTAGTWSRISSNDCQTMTGWANGLAMDFGTDGLWIVDTAWTSTKISGGNAEALNDVDLY